MSATRRRFTTEYKVEAAHRVIDSDRSVAEVARELSINEATLSSWVRDERRRIDAAKGTDTEPLSGAERAELQRASALPSVDSRASGRNPTMRP